MNKQLYKLKSSVLARFVLLAIFSTFVAGCGEDAAQEPATSSADQAVTEQLEPAEVAAAVEEVAADVVDEAAAPAADASFLNYDMVLGDENAPVELIEYASITCNHCATYHNVVLPRIIEKYVDTGKVKVVVRSFLLNGIDAQGSAISRCVPEQRYFAFMDAVFKRQTEWYDIPEYQRLSSLYDQQTANQMFIAQTMDEYSKIARQVGLNKAKIDACMANQEIGEYLFSVQQEGIEKHKVTATPTIIVNGNKTNNDYASIERAIEAALD